MQNYGKDVITVEDQGIIQQVQKRMLVSIGQVARRLGIREGDYVRVEIGDDGASLRIVPIAWHPKEQEYFWSEEWQGRVHRGLKDLEEGRFKTHETVEGLIEELENAADRKNR
ncbi:MAG: AbrB/MazE/SpoVT family DNA-binding domain-containing protein [Desulfotomaculales bacterium]